jgi:hypothetical protein
VAKTIVVDRNILCVRAALSGSALPSVTLTHLSAFTLAVAFASGSPLAIGSLGEDASVRCVLKELPTGAVLMQDATMDASGSGASTLYSAVWDDSEVDSDALRAFLADATGDALWTRKAWLEIQWTVGTTTERTFFPVDIRAAFHQPSDDPPDPTADASWLWLKQRLVAGEGVTFDDDDDAKTRTINSSAAAPANACTATVSDDGLYLEFKTFAGVLIGKCLLNA